MKRASIPSSLVYFNFKKGYIMHRFKFFAIWNMVFPKKN